MTDKDREAVRHLQDALLDDILAATDEESLAELAQDGIDVEKEAEAMKADLARAAGKARMAVAKAAVERDRGRPGASQPRRPVAANDVAKVRKLTMAARNGREQSDGDIRSAAEDMAEIEDFQEQKGESND